MTLGVASLAQSIGIYLQEEGEKTVVLRSENPDLQALEAKAQSLLLPTFLVEDAGKLPSATTESEERALMCNGTMFDVPIL